MAIGVVHPRAILKIDLVAVPHGWYVEGSLARSLAAWEHACASRPLAHCVFVRPLAACSTARSLLARPLPAHRCSRACPLQRCSITRSAAALCCGHWTKEGRRTRERHRSQVFVLHTVAPSTPRHLTTGLLVSRPGLEQLSLLSPPCPRRGLCPYVPPEIRPPTTPGPRGTRSPPV